MLMATSAGSSQVAGARAMSIRALLTARSQWQSAQCVATSDEPAWSAACDCPAPSGASRRAQATSSSNVRCLRETVRKDKGAHKSAEGDPRTHPLGE